MPRRRRSIVGGIIYHVLNRAAARRTLFEDPPDYAAFQRTLHEAHARLPLRILAYCLMPTHWHLVVWPLAGPQHDDDVSQFMRWLTITHTQRWHAHHHTTGTGPVYQGRFKAFPVSDDHHLPIMLRYVERNNLRANLAKNAEDWPWSSLWARLYGGPAATSILSDWPMPIPPDWAVRVNQPETPAELAAVRRAVQRNQPFGPAPWVRQVARQLNLAHTLRPRGRPAKFPHVTCK